MVSKKGKMVRHVRKVKKVNKELARVAELKKKIRTIHAVVTVSIVVLILAFLMFFAMGSKKDVAAVVNGEKIFVDDVDSAYGKIPAQYRLIISRQQVLSQLIDEKLLMQEARAKGIVVTSQEIDSAVEQAISSTGLTREQFDQSLKDNNLTMQQMRDYYGKQMMIYQKLPQLITEGKVSITEEQVNAFYAQNVNLFPEGEEAAKSVVRSYLEAQQKRVIFQQYIAGLRNSSETKIFMNFQPEGEAIGGNCAGMYLPKDTLIFYAEDWCSSCNEIKQIVDSVDAQIVEEGEYSRIMNNCYPDKIPQGMPQLICTKTGESISGELTVSQIKNFVDQCNG